MTKEYLQSILPDFSKAKDAISKLRDATVIESYLKQYDITGHEVTDKTKRPDKIINDKDGNAIGTELVARICVPFQKIIAARAAAFLCANPIKLNAVTNDTNEENFLKAFKVVWDNNKLDYKTLDIAEKTNAETGCAELWYIEKIEGIDDYWNGTDITAKNKLRVQILSKSLGDDLYPVFDEHGDMIAFGRGYMIQDGDKQVEHFDVYTDTQIFYGMKAEGGWTVDAQTHTFTKIPVVWYSQPKPEWADVQPLIDRLEKKLSNHADTNDYFDSPILVVKGQINSLAKKGDSGKVIEVTGEGKVEYATWDKAPESTKLEFDNLVKFIYSLSQTPDISFETLKGVGQISGAALSFMFADAHLKAAKKAGTFGECIQRRINLLKTAIGVIVPGLKNGAVLPIKPVFEYFMPKDVDGMVNTLMTAVQSNLLSQESAIRQNPLVEDADSEIEKIKGEAPTPADNIRKLMTA